MTSRLLTRREILGYAGLGAATMALGRPAGGAFAGLAAPPVNVREFDDGADRIPGGLAGEPERVIVIGAGFAGLAAANALNRAGVRCLVLEGRQRIGGRATTQRVGDTRVDLGASWVHQPEGNPLKVFAEMARVGLIPASPEKDALSILLYDDAFGQVSDPDKMVAYVKALQFDEAFAGIAAGMEPNASYRDGANLFLDQQGVEGDPRRWASFLIQLYSELEGAKSWQHQPIGERRGQIPLPQPNHPGYSGDGLGDFPAGGYSRLVKALAHGSDIRLGHRVVGVSADRSGVKVTVETGSGRRRKRRTIRGSHVLVTVPLGVLKAGSISFGPGLPEVKRAAIRDLGFGNFEKVALTFDRAFWQDEGNTHLLHIDRESSGRMPMFVDLQRIEGKPTLVGLSAGGAARRQVQAGPAAARREAMALLRKVYGSGIPAPVAVSVTGWLKDPFSRGSYSAVVMKTRGDERARLAAPVKGRILFAGEATNLDGRASTTDGAFSSGVREAKRLLGVRAVEITAPGR